MLESYAVILISIVLEALPFVLIGSFVSAAIEVFLPNDFLERHLSGGHWYHYIGAGFLGLIFPICECAIVPVTRRLIRKGMPVGLAMTAMLAIPIMNPVVLLSTYFAFGSDLQMVWLRGGMAVAMAMFIGMIMSRLFVGQQVLRPETEHHEGSDCHCGCHHETEDKLTILDKIHEVITHTVQELLNVGRFLVMGAMIASAMQIVIPRSFFVTLSGQQGLSIAMMMVLAFVLSLCSEADAFIAATFRGLIPDSGLIAFMLYGPMTDIKNTLMMLSAFKRRFVLMWLLLVTLVVFIGTWVISFALG